MNFKEEIKKDILLAKRENKELHQRVVLFEKNTEPIIKVIETLPKAIVDEIVIIVNVKLCELNIHIQRILSYIEFDEIVQFIAEGLNSKQKPVILRIGTNEDTAVFRCCIFYPEEETTWKRKIEITIEGGMDTTKCKLIKVVNRRLSEYTTYEVKCPEATDTEHLSENN